MNGKFTQTYLRMKQSKDESQKNEFYVISKEGLKNERYYLDTLETTSDCFVSKSHENLYRSTLQKHSTLTKLTQLIDVTTPERKKTYWKTYHCKNVLFQDGNKFSGSLCRKRWCQTCNRIKTAEMTNSYKQPLLDLGQLYFVTLTRPNVKERQLHSECKKLIKAFQRIKDNLRKRYGIKLNGMRKIEITYNEIEDTYHPHFHFIQEGQHQSAMLQKLWLEQFPSASIKAQDIRKVGTEDENSFIELFKYATKDIVKSKTTAKAQDNIYKALEGLRIYQTYGSLKKVIAPKEAKEEIDNADFIAPRKEIWIYNNSIKDYTDASDNILIGTERISENLASASST